MAIEYTPQLLIFDLVTQLVIVIATVIMYVKTRELWKLSLQKGLKFLNNAMAFYIVSFGLGLFTTVLDFFSDGIYGTYQITQVGLILSFINMYGGFMGGLYLAYSLMWRYFEKDRIKRSHPWRVVTLNIIVGIFLVGDLFLMIKFNLAVPYLFMVTVILALVYAISANCVRCSKMDISTQNINPFLSLVGLGLGVYIVFLLESLLVGFLFNVHYYSMGLAVVFTVAFLYNILKLSK